MIKQFVKIFSGAILLTTVLAFSFTADATAYKEGVDYEIRAEQKTPKPEIREFFSFWCGHCFAMQDYYAQIAKHFEGKAEFVLNPVSLLGGEMGVETQRAFAVAKSLGIADEYRAKLFGMMHTQNIIPKDHNDLIRIFEDLGVPAETFENDFKSFPVMAQASEYESLTEKLKIDAVPEIVINGKYVAELENINTLQEFYDLIDYLLTLP